MPDLFIILPINLEVKGPNLLSKQDWISVSHLLLIVLFVIFFKSKIDTMAILWLIPKAIFSISILVFFYQMLQEKEWELKELLSN